jgi:apolipoprotein N-acyltransferase
MIEKIDQSKWVLPACSFILLTLSFYPFRIGWLALFALAPLYRFAASNTRRVKDVFIGAAAVGASFSLVLSYLSVVQFHWYSEAFLFETLVNASFVPIALFSALLSGTLVVIRRVRSASPIRNVVIGSGAYLMAELVLMWIFSGYYFGTLAHAVVVVPGALAIASVGGIPLVSFLAVACAMACAEASLAWDKLRAYVPIVIVAISWLVIAGVGTFVFDTNKVREEPLRIAVIQNALRDESAFASVDDDGKTSFSVLAKILEVIPDDVHVVVYPFSPYTAAIDIDGSGYVYSGGVSAHQQSFTTWLQRHIESGETVVTWSTSVEQEEFKNEIIAWNAESIQGRYAKRRLYPFMDYTPAWARSLGIFSTPVDGVPGSGASTIVLDDVQIGGLVCSEINSVAAARDASHESDIIFALGSEAMFVDDVVGTYNLISAQYRAAENGISVVRGSKFGPSGVFDSRGALVAGAPYGWEGELIVDVPVTRRTTIFSKYGGRAIGFVLVVVALLLVVVEERKKRR